MLIGIATGCCSVQDAVQNLLTSFNYLYFICIATYETSIDGSIFFNLYYLYCLSIFQRTCCFRFKSGCKGKRFIFNCQFFSEVFFYFLFQLVSQTLLRKGKNNYKRKSKTVLFANRTAKIRTFRFIFQTFSKVFLFLCLSRLTLYH